MFFTTGYKYEPLIDYSIKVIKIVVLSQKTFSFRGINIRNFTMESLILAQDER